MRRAAGPAARDARWTDPATLHLTLAFLGEVPAAQVEAVARAVEAAAAAGRPLDLEVAGLGAFPSARRPRVLWMGVRGDVAGVRALAGVLAARIGGTATATSTSTSTPTSIAAPKPFSPHLTLARARSPRGAPSLARLLEAPPPEPLAWRATALVLFESHLGPRGARHEALVRAPLGSSPA